MRSKKEIEERFIDASKRYEKAKTDVARLTLQQWITAMAWVLGSTTTKVEKSLKLKNEVKKK